MLVEKECKRCHHIKPVASFYTAAVSKDTFQTWCKECCRLYQREYHRSRYQNDDEFAELCRIRQRAVNARRKGLSVVVVRPAKLVSKPVQRLCKRCEGPVEGRKHHCRQCNRLHVNELARNRYQENDQHANKVRASNRAYNHGRGPSKRNIFSCGA